MTCLVPVNIKLLLIFYSVIFIVQVMSSAQASAWFGFRRVLEIQLRDKFPTFFLENPKFAVPLITVFEYSLWNYFDRYKYEHVCSLLIYDVLELRKLKFWSNAWRIAMIVLARILFGSKLGDNMHNQCRSQWGERWWIISKTIMKHNGLRASHPLQQLVAGGVDDTLSLWVWGGVVGLWMTPSHSQTPAASDCHRRYSDRLHQINI